MRLNELAWVMANLPLAEPQGQPGHGVSILKVVWHAGTPGYTHSLLFIMEPITNAI